MNGAICMLSRGEGTVTSTFEDVHPVAKHSLTGERSLPPLLAPCQYTHVPPCNLLIMICSLARSAHTQSGLIMLK